MIEVADLDKRTAYRLMTSLIVPRPIAWVGTRSGAGVDNLAPFSFFNGVSTQPALVSVSIARGRAGRLKDSLVNILETEVLTISIVSTSLLEKMHQTSASYPPSVSEFEAAGLTPLPAETVAAPRVADALAAMECRLHRAIDLGSVHLVIAEVLGFHVPVDSLVDGALPVLTLSPVGRLGGSYAALGPEILLPPPVD